MKNEENNINNSNTQLNTSVTPKSISDSSLIAFIVIQLASVIVGICAIHIALKRYSFAFYQLDSAFRRLVIDIIALGVIHIIPWLVLMFFEYKKCPKKDLITLFNATVLILGILELLFLIDTDSYLESSNNPYVLMLLSILFDAISYVFMNCCVIDKSSKWNKSQKIAFLSILIVLFAVSSVRYIAFY